MTNVECRKSNVERNSEIRMTKPLFPEFLPTSPFFFPTKEFREIDDLLQLADRQFGDQTLKFVLCRRNHEHIPRCSFRKSFLSYGWSRP